MEKKRLTFILVWSIFILIITAACSTEQPDVVLPTPANTDEFIEQAETRLAQLQNEINDLTTRAENGELSEGINTQIAALEQQLATAQEQLQQFEGITPEEQDKIASEFNDVIKELEESMNTLVESVQQ